MCRWITVMSSDYMSLSDIVLAPQNSLVQLSKDASFHPGYSEQNNHVTNGDGFGVGWYHSNAAYLPRSPSLTNEQIMGHPNLYAAVFRDTAPAWNNANLRELCIATRSKCILAHVRAASRFASVSQENCHPFKAGRLLFCHNGRIDQFPKLKRALLARLTEDAFMKVKGTTDSECMFALALTFLQEDGTTDVSPFNQDTPFGHKRLVNAIKKTLKYVEALLKQAGITDTYSTLNFALSDGDSLVVTRFCDKSPTVLPPSLYWAYGHAQDLIGEVTSKNPAEFVSQLHDAETASETDDDADAGSDPANHSHHSNHSRNNNHNGMNNRIESSGNILSMMGPGASDDDTALTEEGTYDELPIALLVRESLPGLLYSDVEHKKAAFIVASCPLTKTHTWNPMPRNSIMWCTRGQMPEMRLLRSKKSKTPILKDNTIVL